MWGVIFCYPIQAYAICLSLFEIFIVSKCKIYKNSFFFIEAHHQSKYIDEKKEKERESLRQHISSFLCVCLNLFQNFFQHQPKKKV